MSAMKSMAKMLVMLAAFGLAANAAWAHPGGFDHLPALTTTAAAKLAPPAMRDRNTRRISSVGTTNNTGGGGPVNPVPEPTAVLVFGAGVLVTAVALRRRRKQQD